MKFITIFLFLLLCACSDPTVNPPKVHVKDYTELSEELKKTPAPLEKVIVLDTHSMEPFINGGDFVIVDEEFPYEKLKVGDIIIYVPIWLGSNNCHRINYIYADGHMIVSGDNTKSYERGNLEVTKDIYHGKVVKVITLK